ncbi:hypothetical protein EDC54_10168 [Samsonia erythrinae]|uniref:Uncharacterized protein n=1 Tax=Samsonia erythrinae TaxID=160434 RepID=A0A4V2VTS4_9GAMM|nr:hypothetical protein EDC54_10168 [Samsonia erythrinae]
MPHAEAVAASCLEIAAWFKGIVLIILKFCCNPDDGGTDVAGVRTAQ